MQLLSRGAPRIDRTGQPVGLDGANGSIKDHPGHDLGVGEVSARSAYHPDSVIGITPVLGEEFHESQLKLPEDALYDQAVTDRSVDRIHQLAVDIKLELPGRFVADPERR
jgi:hypothetical protein